MELSILVDMSSSLDGDDNTGYGSNLRYYNLGVYLSSLCCLTGRQNIDD